MATLGDAEPDASSEGTMTNPPLDESDDPHLDAEVERALAPYRDLLSDEQLAGMKDMLEHALTTHPVGAALLDRTRPRAAPDHSAGQEKKGHLAPPAGSRPAAAQKKKRSS